MRVKFFYEQIISVSLWLNGVSCIRNFIDAAMARYHHEFCYYLRKRVLQLFSVTRLGSMKNASCSRYRGGKHIFTRDANILQTLNVVGGTSVACAEKFSIYCLYLTCYARQARFVMCPRFVGVKKEGEIANRQCLPFDVTEKLFAIVP